jgi:hypothetical protein
MPAVTSVTNFSDGNVLTATALNAVNCGIHVYSNAAARDAAYGGSGERTLVEGEYAYLLDTDETLVYSGSSWVSVGIQAVKLIETLSPSAVATTQFTDGIITSAYKFYEVKYDLNTTFSFQMRNAGSTITAANYTRGGVAISTGGVVNNNYNTGETAVRIQTSNATPQRFAGTCRLYAPSTSANQLFTFDTSWSQYSGATQQSGAGLTYIYEANQAYTSLLFTATTGTLTGTIKLYGWA